MCLVYFKNISKKEVERKIVDLRRLIRIYVGKGIIVNKEQPITVLWSWRLKKIEAYRDFNFYKVAINYLYYHFSK